MHDTQKADTPGDAEKAPRRYAEFQQVPRTVIPSTPNDPPARVKEAAPQRDVVAETIASVETLLADRMKRFEQSFEQLTGIATALAREQNPFASDAARGVDESVKARSLDIDERPQDASTGQPSGGATGSALVAPQPKTPAPRQTGGRALATPGPALLDRVAHSPRTNAILLSWAQTLLDELGHDGLPEALEYFESVGWIGADVRVRLTRLTDGLQANGKPRPDWRMNRETLQRSLDYIEELRGFAGG